ncbi:MAG: DeoR/GlpR family DNA-binding transcription regulator [Nocardiopsaceae bacterium]|jgi:DeoR/GlpR family transcriptional regulator of sugar metabolism|nr:DeoR/GlpR family DNA-binding transcription regulator [Nocardiopsaceae bacterium]
MLARQRQSVILQDVRRAGSVRVSDLTQRLGVSDMTVRRDLEVLARAGLIEKVHGGAVLPGAPSSHEPGFEAKSVLEQPQKAAISRAAAALVTPGTAIGLSAGTTTFALAEQLVTIAGLTIVTNSVRIVSLFGQAHDNPGAQASVVLTGGIRTPSDALVGPIADLTIRSLHLDMLFLGCHGIDPAAGLTTPNLAEAETNRAFMQAARKVTVIADHTKWGIVGLSSFAALDDVDTLIIDSGLQAEARALVADRVGQLIIADAPAKAG